MPKKSSGDVRAIRLETLDEGEALRVANAKLEELARDGVARSAVYGKGSVTVKVTVEKAKKGSGWWVVWDVVLKIPGHASAVPAESDGDQLVLALDAEMGAA